VKRVPYSLALLWLLAFQVASSGAAVDEQVREMRIEPGVRVLINHPASIDPAKPTTIVFYACPTGNTIEQTFGRAPGEGVDWRHDIQHAGAQIRRLREVDPGRNIVLVLLEAEGKSWPAGSARSS